LFEDLTNKGLTANIYAFPCEWLADALAVHIVGYEADAPAVMTFCAATPPLDEALKLWE
jgi:hypothetical protein